MPNCHCGAGSAGVRATNDAAPATLISFCEEAHAEVVDPPLCYVRLEAGDDHPFMLRLQFVQVMSCWKLSAPAQASVSTLVRAVGHGCSLLFSERKLRSGMRVDGIGIAKSETWLGIGRRDAGEGEFFAELMFLAQTVAWRMECKQLQMHCDRRSVFAPSDSNSPSVSAEGCALTAAVQIC